MMRFRKKPQITRSDALGCTPIKNADIAEMLLDTGELLLTYPVRLNPWAAALMRRVGIGPRQAARKKLQLDALGTAVWGLLDGHRTVGQVSRAFARKHQLHPKEAEAAVARFVRELGRRGLIGLRQGDGSG